ncbi:MAF flag10 domain containing protein [Nitrosopumilus sp. b1]|uniref:6-hydroxymethylpterin diphosphokinase MptE-like protein n=1 Tax=Nitrosopumilus sp. b1 TaxID=2109907 RepID=UPI0015F6B4AA|nr:6-hydroxymethylpterin diphosphokinase MptE-like protein [Nitrosopumilus sp. b1]KAF6242368.1 MAF flag10 domain containing protein [Nitrosopumilus sp. b1]
MTIIGWNTRYNQILKEFGFSKKKDLDSAKKLDSLLKQKKESFSKIKKIISQNTVIVIGSGGSLETAIPIIKKLKKIPKIAADSSVSELMKNKIIPDIVVTDLDGEERYLKEIAKSNSFMVVHAHGDNQEKLELVKNFNNCIGTTQTESFGVLYNFGGFTDGDRCVFLADSFGAKDIILFGMDFGKKIGKFSQTMHADTKIKLKKLRWGKKLLEWLATKSKSNLYTTSDPIKGFKKISYNDLDDIIIT